MGSQKIEVQIYKSREGGYRASTPIYIEIIKFNSIITGATKITDGFPWTLLQKPVREPFWAPTWEPAREPLRGHAVKLAPENPRDPCRGPLGNS